MSGRELPAGWELVDFEALVASAQNGLSKRQGDEGTAVPVLRLADFDGRQIAPKEPRGILMTDRERSELSLRQGDLLCVRVNGSENIVGRFSVFRRDGEWSFCDHFIRYRLNSAALSEYVERFFETDLARRHIESSFVSSAGQKTVNRGIVGGAQIPLAPVPEQRRIVEKIEALTARSRRAREALDALPTLIDRYRQSILAAAFRGDLTAEWRSGRADVDGAITLDAIREAFRNRQSKVVAPKPDWERPENIPFGWACERLELLCDPSRGIPYGIVQTGEPFMDGVPTVRCGDIKDYRIDLERLKRVDPSVAAEYSRTRLCGGEVLIAIRGTVGATAVAGPEMAGMNISREVAMLPVLPGLDARYLCYLMTSPLGAAHLMQHVKGVAQSGINLSDLRNFPVLLPHIDEQLAIVKALDAAFDRLRRLNELVTEKADRLSTLDQSILAKAFRGELVPQDPNDEPASVLLERIRAERAAAGEKPRRGRRAAGG